LWSLGWSPAANEPWQKYSMALAPGTWCGCMPISIWRNIGRSSKDVLVVSPATFRAAGSRVASNDLDCCASIMQLFATPLLSAYCETEETPCQVRIRGWCLKWIGRSQPCRSCIFASIRPNIAWTPPRQLHTTIRQPRDTSFAPAFLSTRAMAEHFYPTCHWAHFPDSLPIALSADI
jgi:hypothetical protein